MKTYKGWELIRDIAEGKIKSGTQIKVHSPNYDTNYWFCGNWFGEKDGYSNKPDNIELYLCQPHCTFELIEEQQDIDIQEIKKFDEIRDCSVWDNDVLSTNQRNIVSKVNLLVESVKQLDRKIKEE